MKRKRRKHAKAKNNTLVYRFIFVFIIIFIVGAVIGSCVAATIAKAYSGNTATTAPGNEKANAPRAQTFEALDCDLSESLQEYTYNLCKAYDVDFCFAMALMYTESGFDANAISSTNDYGLMQINIVNADEIADKLGIYELTEPHLNIHAGLYLLGKLSEEYQGNRAKVCMAYNMGASGASQLWEQGIYENDYSKKVLTRAALYKKELEERQ